MKLGGRTGAPGKGRVPKAGSGGGVPGAGGPEGRSMVARGHLQGEPRGAPSHRAWPAEGAGWPGFQSHWKGLARE